MKRSCFLAALAVFFLCALCCGGQATADALCGVRAERHEAPSRMEQGAGAEALAGALSASDISVLDSSVEAHFPTALVFKLEAESNTDIVDTRLHYQVDRMSYAEVTSEAWPAFSPSGHIETSWTWDMRRSSLPPDAVVRYWWTLRDAGGAVRETEQKTISFVDGRYDWERLTEGQINLLWYEGGASFAGELMDVCQQGLRRLTEDIGASPEGSIDIYVYASAGDLQGAMIFPQEWTGGAAFTEFGTIAIGIAPDRLEWGKRALVHELTHLVVHQATFNPYGDLPTWLDEGLAMYNEGELGAAFRSRLESGVRDGNLISVRTLCSPFSAHPERAYLAYAESYSLVDYVISEYGGGAMLELLDVFAAGSSYDGALEEVYGFDIEGLDRRWRDHVETLVLAEAV